MLDSVVLLRALGVVEAVERPNKVPGDSPDAIELWCVHLELQVDILAVFTERSMAYPRTILDGAFLDGLVFVSRSYESVNDDFRPFIGEMFVCDGDCKAVYFACPSGSAFTVAPLPAQRESANAFGDDTMYIERFIENPRHVEIQIMADKFGNVVALGERDCSVQRNHQKLIEESPSPAINDEIRNAMNRDAVLAARTVNYTNAGTVEFILDPKGSYYFMEMNTRIQVEHGVTEMVTGTDLIIEQIRVAMGEPLSFNQEGIQLRGHAIECRINAEIPQKNFMPSPGVVKHLHLPAGNGVRVDTALYTGYRIPSEYDSMIAKVIVHAPDRNAAIQKMRSALDEMVILGVETNLDFQFQIMRNPEFCEGRADTGFIQRMLRLD